VFINKFLKVTSGIKQGRIQGSTMRPDNGRKAQKLEERLR
jgi:hypothetical protein